MQDGSAPGWREIMEQRHSALIAEVGRSVDAHIASEVARAVSEEKRRGEAQTAQALQSAQAEAARTLTNVHAESAQALSEAREEARRSLEEARRALEQAQAEAMRASEQAQADARRASEQAQAEAMRASEKAQAEAMRVSKEEKERVAEQSRRRLAESLNQTLRRIRQTSAEHEALQLVLEESAFCATRAVVVLVESHRVARLAAWRDVTLRGDEEESGPIDLKEAAALAACVESGDPVAALASPAEISSVLTSAFGRSGEEKVYLFPIRVRQNTVGLMVAGGEVVPAALELLCQAAGMRLEAIETAGPVAAAAPAPTEASGLVQIASVRKATSAGSWESLSPQEQAQHLRAQRTARVRVAQIRISEAAALRKGVQEREIYRALRPSIDAARGEFQQNYMTHTPGMVDYLHLEIVRSLAHDNDQLLGAEYPGPMA